MKEKLIQIGGKLWVKEGKELRVYLKKEQIELLMKEAEIAHQYQSEFDVKSLEKATSYFDIAKNKFFCDVGTVRNMIRSCGLVVEKI